MVDDGSSQIEDGDATKVAPPKMPPGMPVGQSQPDLYAVSSDDRTMGMLVHLLALLTGIIGSLILWLVKKDQSRFVDHHGKEAINFQLTLMLSMLVLIALSIVSMGVGLILAVPLMFALVIATYVLEILACVAASRGEWHCYPMTIRFIR